jgi:predicted RNase H-like nuclease (RuvC/YqgF family)
LSASQNDDNTYSINAAELMRWLDSNGRVNGKSKRNKTVKDTSETPIGNSALQAEADGLRAQVELLKSERDDLRERLDREAEERRQITTRLLEHEKPKGFWARLTGR